MDYRRQSIVPSNSADLVGQHHGAQMSPNGPYGLPVLNRMHYRALTSVLEEQERTLRAGARKLDAEVAVAHAFVGREVARELLRNIDVVTADERNRIRYAHDARVRQDAAAARIESLQAELECARLQAQIDELRGRRAQPAPPPPPVPKPAPPDQFAQAAHTLGRVPEMMAAKKAAKERIVNDAGGDSNVSEGDQEVFDAMDALVQSTLSRAYETTEL
jgi:hypothetical protein